MKFHNADIVISAVSPDQYPNNQLPEIAVAGRSNVGKSSFINSFLHRKSLARTSGKPGKTRTINFFIVDDLFHLVDVPGYGYARVSKTERNKWAGMMEVYFSSREELVFTILLIDGRHAPTEQDIQMYQYLKYLEIPVLVVATKIDKVKKNQQQKHRQRIIDELQLDEYDDIILYSSETGQGRDEVTGVVAGAVN